MAKTLCYGATYSFLSFYPSQNLFMSLVLLPIYLRPSTCLITTLSALLTQTDPSAQNTKFKSLPLLSRFTSFANPSPLLFSSPHRHIFLNTLPKSPFHNCSTDLDLNSEPPFSLHPIAPIMQIFQQRHLEQNQVVLPMQM
jgi:hypothetical protein